MTSQNFVIKDSFSLDLSNLYHELLVEIMPLKKRDNESIGDFFKRAEFLKVKTKEKEKLELKLKRENQFNRKVEINQKFK